MGAVRGASPAGSAAIVPPANRHSPSTRLVLIWLLLVPLAVAFRLPPLEESLWLDELHTSWSVRGPWSAVAGRAAEGNQGPVYFWSVWCCVRALGESEWTLRLVSLVAGVALVPTVAWLCFLWTRSAILSTLAACLAALDPHCVYFAREARPYALAQWLVVVHFLAFTGRLAGRRSSRWTWNLSLWLAFFTHCTTILVLPAELLVLLATRWRRRLRSPVQRRAWLQDLGLGLAAAAYSLPYLKQLAARRSNWEEFVPVPDTAALGRLFATTPYLLVPLLAALVFSLIATVGGRSPIVHAVERRSVLVFLQRVHPRNWLRIDWRLLLIVAWYLVPACLAWTSTRWGIAAIFFRRYLMATAVAWFLFAAWCGLRVPPRLPRALFAVLVLVASAATHRPWIDFYYGRHSGEDWRSAVACVRQASESGKTTLWLRPGLIEDWAAAGLETSGPSSATLPASDSSRGAAESLRDYLQFPVRGMYPIAQSPDRVEILPRDWNGWSDRQWRRVVDEGSGVLLARGTRETRATLLKRCEAAALARGKRWIAEEAREFPGLTVVRFRLEVDETEVQGAGRREPSEGLLPKEASDPRQR